MPGILTGLAQGLGQAQATNQRQQQIDLEQERFQNAERRQKAQDALQATQTEINDLAHEEAPDIAVLHGAPEAPTGTVPTDPNELAAYNKAKAAHEAYTNSDAYKKAIQNVNSRQERLSALNKARQAQLNALAGSHLADLPQTSAQTLAKLTNGGLGAVTGRELADTALYQTKLPPDTFLRDPQTGRSRLDDALDSIAQGLKTGQWDGREGAIGMLMPETLHAVGHELPNGNVVTGAAPAHLFIDPKDPGYVHVSHVVRSEAPDGTVSHGVTPPMADGGARIKISDLVKRAQQLGQWRQTMDAPDAQQKLADALQNGDTVMHDTMRSFAAAGVPEAQLLPQYKVQGVSGGYLTERPGQAPEFTRTMQVKQPADLQEIEAYMQANPGIDYNTAADIVAARKHGYERLKNPNVSPSANTPSYQFMTDDKGNVVVGDRHSGRVGPARTPRGEPAPTNLHKIGNEPAPASPEKTATDIDNAALKLMKSDPSLSYEQARSQVEEQRKPPEQRAKPKPKKASAVDYSHLWK